MRVRRQHDGCLHRLLRSLEAQERKARLGNLDREHVIELAVGLVIDTWPLGPLNQALTDWVAYRFQNDAVLVRHKQCVHETVVVADHLNKLVARCCRAQLGLGVRVHGKNLVAGLEERKEPGRNAAPAVKHGVRPDGIHEPDARHALI